MSNSTHGLATQGASSDSDGEDQALGCPTHVNFVAPSSSRDWTKAHKIHERHLAKFCREERADLPGAPAKKGTMQFSLRPDGGSTAMVFSSATPHCGVGAAGKQTSMVFWQGEGASAYLSKKQRPTSSSAKFCGGKDSNGAPAEGCHKDAVVPLVDVFEHVDPVAAGDPKTKVEKQDRPSSLTKRA